MSLEFKSALAAPEPLVAPVDSDEGIVVALVSVTGVPDDVDDIIIPGAYTKTLAARRPKVCWAHSWEQPVGRVLHIEELLPGDSRLPAQTKDGKPWPPAAGGLIATMQFNLKSDRGKEAFAAVRFFTESGECAWSIGYQVPPGQSTKRADGIRMIKSLDLYELSFVLHGAAPLATTLALKDALSLMHERKDAAAVIGGAGDSDTADDADADGLDDLDDDAWSWVDKLADDLDDDENDRDDDTDGPLDTPIDEAKIALTPAWDAEVKRAVPTAKRRAMAKRGHALPDGSYPIGTEDDLRNAIRAAGRAKPADREKVKRHIVKRARALGKHHLIPAGWRHARKALDAALELKYDTSPVGEPGGRQNWVDKAGGLPPFIRAIAHAMIRDGKDESRAIQLAVAAVRRWAAGGGDVTEKTREKARAALARWEAMKAGPHADGKSAAAGAPQELLVTGWDPSLEVGPNAAHRAPATEMKGVPRLAGTWEERLDRLRAAACAALGDDTPEGDGDGGVAPRAWVCIAGTYDDHIIVTREKPSIGDEEETFLIPFTWDIDGEPILGKPEEVRLSLTVEGADPDGGDDDDLVDLGDDGPMLVLPMILDHAAFAAKMLTRQAETKAGRVLSGANVERIRAAYEQIGAVLRAAGALDAEPAEEQTDPAPVGDEMDVKDLEVDAAEVAELAASLRR
jgi:hypothetical protein